VSIGRGPVPLQDSIRVGAPRFAAVGASGKIAVLVVARSSGSLARLRPPDAMQWHSCTGCARWPMWCPELSQAAAAGPCCWPGGSACQAVNPGHCRW